MLVSFLFCPRGDFCTGYRSSDGCSTSLSFQLRWLPFTRSSWEFSSHQGTSPSPSARTSTIPSITAPVGFCFRFPGSRQSLHHMLKSLNKLGLSTFIADGSCPFRLEHFVLSSLHRSLVSLPWYLLLAGTSGRGSYTYTDLLFLRFTILNEFFSISGIIAIVMFQLHFRQLSEKHWPLGHPFWTSPWDSSFLGNSSSVDTSNSFNVTLFPFLHPPVPQAYSPTGCCSSLLTCSTPRVVLAIPL